MITLLLGGMLAAAASQEPTADPDGDAPWKIPQTGLGSRVVQARSRAAATLTILLGEDIEALGVPFLPDALRVAPGLEVVRISATESNVSLRSYNDDSSSAQGIFALVDGRPVYNDFFGGVVWETLPVSLDGISRVEIIRGPGSFLYGPNAMHGLVNIVTKSPLEYDDNYFSVYARAGTYRAHSETATYVRRKGDTAVKVTVARDDINEFEPRDRNAKDKAFVEIRAETRLDEGRDAPPSHGVDVSAGVSEQKFRILIPEFGGLPAAHFENEAQETFARATYTLGALRVQSSWTRFDARATPDQVYSPFDVLLDTGDLDAQYSLTPFPVLTLTGGAGTRWSAFETDDLDVADGRHGTALRWGFAQGELEVMERLWFTGGLRIDDHSVAGTRLSPRLALVWQVAQEEGDPEGGQYLRATAGYGFRNPSLRETWFSMPVLGGAGTILGNRDLEPERIRSMEVGYWGRPHERVQVEVNAYYNLVDDLMEFQPAASAPPVPFAPQNVHQEEAYGIEALVETRVVRNLILFGNYAYELRYDRETHDRIAAGPKHKANVGVRYFRGEGLILSLWANYFDEVSIDDPAAPGGPALIGALDDYLLLNARAAYRFTVRGARAEVFVQAFNLLDDDHTEQPQGDPYGLLLSAGVDVRW